MDIFERIIGFLHSVEDGVDRARNAFERIGAGIIRFVPNPIREAFGFSKRKKKVPSEAIKAALRKQWLEVGKDQQIPGVEWEDEVYYDTPH